MIVSAAFKILRFPFGSHGDVATENYAFELVEGIPTTSNTSFHSRRVISSISENVTEVFEFGDYFNQNIIYTNNGILIVLPYKHDFCLCSYHIFLQLCIVCLELCSFVLLIQSLVQHHQHNLVCYVFASYLIP